MLMRFRGSSAGAHPCLCQVWYLIVSISDQQKDPQKKHCLRTGRLVCAFFFVLLTPNKAIRSLLLNEMITKLDSTLSTVYI